LYFVKYIVLYLFNSYAYCLKQLYLDISRVGLFNATNAPRSLSFKLFMRWSPFLFIDCSVLHYFINFCLDMSQIFINAFVWLLL